MHVTSPKMTLKDNISKMQQLGNFILANLPHIPPFGGIEFTRYSKDDHNGPRNQNNSWDHYMAHNFKRW